MSFSHIKNPDGGQFVSRNPATKAFLERYAEYTTADVEKAIEDLHNNLASSCAAGMDARLSFLGRFTELLRRDRIELASAITEEMGKLVGESLGEIDKSIELCEQFINNGPGWLADNTEGGARISYGPVGVVLAVMPWNFPVWQVLRCAVPAWLAGNTLALKHATNVSRCALRLEQLVAEASEGATYLRTLLIGVDQIADVVADSRVRALHFTGSITVGRRLAALAAAGGKRSVLELGGSDPFIVLDGANIEEAAQAAVTARFRNAGQSCTAAKRLIVASSVYDEFVASFTAKMQRLVPGDPMQETTSLAPLARQDFLLRLKQQVEQALAGGGAVVAKGPEVSDKGWFAQPLLMSVMQPSTLTVGETFGPVATVQRVSSEEQAVQLANDSRYGLGASIWGDFADDRQTAALAGKLQCGVVAFNRLVRSSALLPFGGVKDSGYGYELGRLGLMELVTAKVVLAQ